MKPSPLSRGRNSSGAPKNTGDESKTHPPTTSLRKEGHVFERVKGVFGGRWSRSPNRSGNATTDTTLDPNASHIKPFGSTVTPPEQPPRNEGRLGLRKGFFRSWSRSPSRSRKPVSNSAEPITGGIEPPQTLGNQHNSNSPINSRPGSSGTLTSTASASNRRHDRIDSIWEKAFNSLADEDRQTLTVGEDGNKLDILSHVMTAVEVKRDLCKQKQWKFTYGGKKIVLRDVADKLVMWVEKFKQIGDIAIQVDPAHAALPWAGFRFLLQLAIEDSQKMGSILVCLEKIAILIDRCTIYEELYLGTGLKSAENLQNALVLLYSAILVYMVRAKQFYTQNTAARMASGIFDIDGFQPLLDAITEKDSIVCREASVAEAEYQRYDNGKIGVDGHQKLKEILGELGNLIMRVDSNVASILDNLQDSERTNILRWLSVVPYRGHHERVKEGRVAKTGEWLFEKSIYKEWQNSSTSMVFWLHGIPGAGKTMLTSTVVDAIQNELNARSNDEGFAYFYCGRGGVAGQDPESVLRAILKQLSCTRSGALQSPVICKYQESKRDGFSSDYIGIEQSTTLILEVLKVYPKATIIVDALDECETRTRVDLLEAFGRVVESAPNLIKIFVSSRNDINIMQHLEGITTLQVLIETGDNMDDIKKFVESKVTECIRKRQMLDGIEGKVRDELKELICTTLIRDANGMFLWANLQIEALCELSTEWDIRRRLGKLPHTLEATYAEIFKEKISSSKGHGAALAHRAMMWIMCSVELLSPNQLVTAAVVGLQLAPDSWKGSDVKLETILKLCHNLVVLDRQLNVMRFAHFSVQEYLKKQWDMVDVNTMATEVCISLLKDLKTLIPPKQQTLREYSILYWPYHLELCNYGGRSDKLSTQIKDFIGSFYMTGPMYVNWFINVSKDLMSMGYFDRGRISFRAVAVALYMAEGGLHDHPLHTLLAIGAMDTASLYDKTIIHGGKLLKPPETSDDARILAEIKIKGSQIASGAGSSAVCAAVLCNRLDTVRALVEAGGDLNTQSTISGKTALHHALELRSKPIISYMMSKIANPQLLKLRDMCLEDLDWAQKEPWHTDLQSNLKSNTFQNSKSRTSRDVLQARLILHKGLRLPLSVVDYILDTAEYWVCTTVSRKEVLIVDQQSRKAAYIRVPVRSRLGSPVRKIVIRTRSHDQGWSSEEQFNGTYAGSWTWFEAGAITDPTSDQIPPWTLTIIRNVRGSSEARTHTLTWDARDETAPKAWMNGLAPGHMISVFPRAEYPGWVHTVEKVEMEVYCAWV